MARQGASPFEDVFALAEEADPADNDSGHDTRPQRPTCEPAPSEPAVSADGSRAPIGTLGLSVRSYNALLRAGIVTVADLAASDPRRIRSIPNVGAKSSAEIEHARVLAKGGVTGSPPGEVGPPGSPRLASAERDDSGIESLKLGSRSYNALRRAGILTVADLGACNAGQLGSIPNLGPKSLAEIEEALARVDSRLAEPSPLGYPSREPLRPPVSPAIARRAEHTSERRRRANAMVEMLLEGRTSREVADHFGISGARVQQIAAARGVDATQRRAARRSRLLTQAAEHQDEILSLYRRGQPVATIASRLALPTETVTALLDATVDQADRGAHRVQRLEARAPAKRTWSDEDVRAAVRAVADATGDVPTSAQYTERARMLGLPSLPTVVNRFGSWSAAVTAAGMTPLRAPRRQYGRRWSADACWRALQGMSRELGGPPTASQYGLIAQGRDDLPSPATIRQRLGTWNSVVARLLTGAEHPLLGRLGIDPDGDPNETQEAIWLAYLAEELTETELAGLVRSGMFVWDESYGEMPEALDPEA